MLKQQTETKSERPTQLKAYLLEHFTKDEDNSYNNLSDEQKEEVADYASLLITSPIQTIPIEEVRTHHTVITSKAITDDLFWIMRSINMSKSTDDVMLLELCNDDPNLAKYVAAAAAAQFTASMMSGYSSPYTSEERKHYYQQLMGPNIDGWRVYMSNDYRYFLSVLLMDPAEYIALVTTPDDMCRACVMKIEGAEHAPHCDPDRPTVDKDDYPRKSDDQDEDGTYYLRAFKQKIEYTEKQILGRQFSELVLDLLAKNPNTTDEVIAQFMLNYLKIQHPKGVDLMEGLSSLYAFTDNFLSGKTPEDKRIQTYLKTLRIFSRYINANLSTLYKDIVVFAKDRSSLENAITMAYYQILSFERKIREHSSNRYNERTKLIPNKVALSNGKSLIMPKIMIPARFLTDKGYPSHLGSFSFRRED
jgi:hypothetical protein